MIQYSHFNNLSLIIFNQSSRPIMKTELRMFSYLIIFILSNKDPGKLIKAKFILKGSTFKEAWDKANSKKKFFFMKIINFGVFFFTEINNNYG
ncbi:hypothetical protein BpHYR1_040847 [Brachionus plicatilis]|uniref:Uncharacterized protein n=1 Tax=Brachionus plicatilis TaxID=10195 RepID=A0A3M7S578_BRAPC|nr:hypothetical protein BpHYR1_040847 [Brachionus plicatilis]